jgi:hypothetical protein
MLLMVESKISTYSTQPIIVLTHVGSILMANVIVSLTMPDVKPTALTYMAVKEIPVAARMVARNVLRGLSDRRAFLLLLLVPVSCCSSGVAYIMLETDESRGDDAAAECCLLVVGLKCMGWGTVKPEVTPASNRKPMRLADFLNVDILTCFDE